METGAFTGYFDVAQVVLYVFWLFFAGLLLYLRKQDRQEGYPLVDVDRGVERYREHHVGVLPPPKTFLLGDGETYVAPPGAPDRLDVAVEPAARFPGAPYRPTGNAMRDGVGPAAWAARRDVPDMTAEDLPRIVPIRVDPHHYVVEEDPNPVGMPVIAGDGREAGVVRDLWVDRSEPMIRYLEVEVPLADGARRVLMPMAVATVSRKPRQVRTKSILSTQFADVPGIKNPDLVTKLEEDKICAYFAGGYMYATPQRAEPLL